MLNECTHINVHIGFRLPSADKTDKVQTKMCATDQAEKFTDYVDCCFITRRPYATGIVLGLFAASVIYLAIKIALILRRSKREWKRNSADIVHFDTS